MFGNLTHRCKMQSVYSTADANWAGSSLAPDIYMRVYSHRMHTHTYIYICIYSCILKFPEKTFSINNFPQTEWHRLMCTHVSFGALKEKTNSFKNFFLTDHLYIKSWYSVIFRKPTQGHLKWKQEWVQFSLSTPLKRLRATYLL